MDSIGQLSSSLPPDLQDKQLQASFRQAALSITELFKHGKRASTKAYISGQRQALQEVLEFLQALLDQPASQPGTSAAPAAGTGPVDVGRLINFICARQEALKAEEEDHDDEDAAGPPPAAPPVRRSASAAPAPASPLRPGVAFQRTTSSGNGVPPRPASAAPSTSSRHHPRDHPTSSAPASPPSSAFSPPYPRASGGPSASHHFAAARSTTASAPSTSAFTAPVSSTPAGSAAANLTWTAPASPSPLTPHSHTPPTFATGPASPLGRAAGRSLRPRGGAGGGTARDRASSKPASSVGGATPAPGAAVTAPAVAEVGVGVGMGGGGDFGFEVGMKRRWPAGPGGGGGAVGVGSGGAGDFVELAPPGTGGADGSADGMDVEGMAMDGWDGVGERPLKRVTRRAGAGGGTDPSGAEDCGGQAQR